MVRGRRWSLTPGAGPLLAGPFFAGPLLAVSLFALGLRLLRVPARWCANAWLYAAYPAATVQALRASHPGQALTTFSGLHPPLWPTLHAATELLLPVPLLWLLGAALASTLAAVLVARRDPLAGLLLATGPLQLSYAAEVNGYPLALLAVTAVLVQRPAVAAGASPWGLAACAMLATWTHALGGVVAGLVALGLPGRARLQVLGLMAVATLPLLPGVLALAREPSTTGQPPIKVGLILADWQSRYGLLWLLLLPLAALAAPRDRWLALPLLGLAAAITAFTLARIAAPHQQPYWLLAGPPLALLAASGARRHRLLIGLALALGLAQGGRALVHGLADLRALDRDQARTRAVDLALAELDRPWTCAGEPGPACAGDALVLLFPRRVDDDDKRPLNPLLWRLPPWRPMPAVRPAAFDWGDYRNGQPRLVPRGDQRFVVYVDDQAREELVQDRAAHSRLWVVVAHVAPDDPAARGVSARLGAPPQVVDGDLLWRP